MTSQTILYAIYALVAAAGILVIEATYMSLTANRRRQSTINYRLKKLTEDQPAEHTLRLILKERGLSETGDYSYGLVALNRLYVQSGVRGNPATFALGFLIAGITTFVVLTILDLPVLIALAGGVAVAVVLPLLFLRRARARRIRNFERQLPNALDMIVRSLKAGHPTSVAVALVAREMADPVGSEFGIVADEVTFGSDLETAVRKMAERVGYEGLRLLSVALSIQAKTGGNLSDILTNLSKVLRERNKLRLKIRALASEGRVSAIMLSAFPIIMFAILQVIAPTFYGQVWGDPLILPVFTVFGVWGLFGDYIMYRMVTFDF